MRSCDVDLMKIETIHENPNSSVVIDMAIYDLNVTITLHEVDTMPDVPNHDAVEDGLHGPTEFESIGFRVGPLDGDVADRGHSFEMPSV